MCFSAAASSEKFHGSANLASNTAPVTFTRPRPRSPPSSGDGVKDLALHFRDHVSGVHFEPVMVQLLGHIAELDEQIGREVFRLDFPAF
jgi:hypothetical protein